MSIIVHASFFLVGHDTIIDINIYYCTRRYYYCTRQYYHCIIRRCLLLYMPIIGCKWRLHTYVLHIIGMWLLHSCTTQCYDGHVSIVHAHNSTVSYNDFYNCTYLIFSFGAWDIYRHQCLLLYIPTLAYTDTSIYKYYDCMQDSWNWWSRA